MGSARNTRKEILDAAEELLQTRGFQGFSYHHIAAQLGLRNAAIHYHFPSKADLGVALVSRYREGFAWWVARLREQKAGPAECLERFLAIERRYLLEGRVCPLGVVGVEYLGVPEEMRSAAAALLEEVAGWLAQVLEEGRRAGAVSFAGDARSRAWSLMSALQGGLQLARLRGAEEIFDRIVDQLRLDLHLPAAPERSARAAAAQAAGGCGRIAS